jgi:hypothetical protein
MLDCYYNKNIKKYLEDILIASSKAIKIKITIELLNFIEEYKLFLTYDSYLNFKNTLKNKLLELEKENIPELTVICHKLLLSIFNIKREPVDVKPVDVKPVDVKPVDVKPVDVKPVDVKPVDVKPVEFACEMLMKFDQDLYKTDRELGNYISCKNSSYEILGFSLK